MSSPKTADLKGLVMLSVTAGDDTLTFKCEDGRTFQYYHEQDCCEDVRIEDIVGDLSDLVGEPLLVAEESTSGENPEGINKSYQDSFTWTFYKLATSKGYVDVRWYGESNGYYSESVDLRVF